VSSSQEKRPATRGTVRTPARRGGQLDGAKRNAILAAATERFGRDGYEHTKWADIAGDVGVGPTALYHYFESKQHCLYVLIDEAVDHFRQRFVALTADAEDPLTALTAVLQDVFDLSEHEVLRNRMLVSEQGLLASPSSSPREEEARQTARARARELDFAWASFLAGAMRAGAIPKADPRLMTRAILGLYNSIWQWYRPAGSIGLQPIADFYKARVLAMIGVGPDGVIRPRMVA
jgi:TetR/AcrR family transcriptional regulator, cholesterol catabolism regulator